MTPYLQNNYDIVYCAYMQELKLAYGKLSAEAVIQIVGTVQTGNLQAVVYDLEVYNII